MFGCERAFKSLISRIAVIGNFVNGFNLVIAIAANGEWPTYALFLMVHEDLLERDGGVVLLRSRFVYLTAEWLVMYQVAF